MPAGERQGGEEPCQQAESYLYLLRGTRVLYEATLKPEYLEFALEQFTAVKRELGI